MIATIQQQQQQHQLQHSELSQHHHHQQEFDQQESISALTNRSMTESPTCSELSMVTSATSMPNTPISPHNLVTHHHHHSSNHHHQSALILDHSSSQSMSQFSSISGNNLHQSNSPPISSSPSNMSTKLDTYGHSHSHPHHHLMPTSKSTDQLNPMATAPSLAMVASCQQGGPGEFSMSTATLTISSPMMAGQNSQSQSSNVSIYIIVHMIIVHGII